MKIIFGIFVFGSFLEKYLLNKNNIGYNNLEIEMVFKSIMGIIIYLIVYLSIRLFINESLFISITLLILDIIFMEYLGSKILKKDNYNIKVLPIIIIFLSYILFAFLTFYPPQNDLFFDTTKMIYGIPKK